ncbi:PREDICTED: inhibitor of nuclear factor kappa-B kinase subunit beta-like [Amphimedon queenslandica]|uniref:IkappaB kinase n=1 Tax=Amphimedon queenslandica TaxID=400682 RepID=A0A1X7UQ23_AMPQE|nr:PREDICTED: inhibitor of nuclear factor kappa-B kinase subunit beta-like [Amphimedon queenslandica]|eukprot:XP_003387126.1 PREDICTED: inhibitor of nuclear factor kappa-B kinase subunit beta-like [Amphimedon queenslandica]
MAFRGKSSGGSVAHCDGYAWDLKSLLGKGSYGNVYKGWNSQKTAEVAVKVVRKDLFRQDPKAEQNLMREIDVLKKLRQCEYVVHLYHVQDMQRADAIVMVMELCECDLDHLIKVKPFCDQDVTVLLHQLGEGMKALRAHNIVHRDIKPGNILIKYHPKTGKMMIKLADFGFARHFKDESMKPLDLTSLAGTPVFMAPEALRCVFNPGVEHYDDKVDLWSIGALIYKVLVGQCGFYAQLNHILHILDKKGDAIAWEPSTAPNYGPVPKVKYIYELPASLDERLSAPFKQKMNQLLVSLLKLDALERMTYPEFFDFVDDLLKSKVEVVNLLHGTGFKFMVESDMKPEDLMNDIELAAGTPVEHQVIFSSQSDIYISKNSNTSQNDFNLFMNRAGGSQGHAVIYFIPVNEVTADLLEPDYGALAKLYYCVESKSQCVELITGRKYSDEIVHSIGSLEKQIERQFSCIQEFRAFCTKQFETLIQSLANTRQLAQETIAKATLACDWLSSDISVLNKGTGISPAAAKTFKDNVTKVKREKNEIDGLVSEMETSLKKCENTILRAPSLQIDDLIENAKKLSKKAKSLTSIERQFIYQMCEELLQLCKGLIVSSTDRAHKMLKGLYTALYDIWNVSQKASALKVKQDNLNKTLTQGVPEWRAELLRSTKSAAAAPVAQSQNQQGWSQLQQDIAAKNEHIRTIEAENAKLHQQIADKEAPKLDPTLAEKFKTFCISAKRLIDPSSASRSPSNKSKDLYPILGAEDSTSSGYLVVEGQLDLNELIPEASLHLDILQQKLLSGASGFGDEADIDQVHIRITYLENYKPGDIVLFHPVGRAGQAGQGNIHLNLLHLKKPRPYAILEPECYPAFGYRQGRIADLVIGMMDERSPEEASFKDNPVLAKQIGEPDGSERKFYRIWAKPAKIDFVRTRASSGSAKSKPQPVGDSKNPRKNDFI